MLWFWSEKTIVIPEEKNAEPTTPGKYVISKSHAYNTPTWAGSVLKWGTKLKDMPSIKDVYYKLPSGKWVFNDFGPIAIRYFKDLNSNKILDDGEILEGRMIHTTAEDEALHFRGKKISLTESHGCIHIKPAARSYFISKNNPDIVCKNPSMSKNGDHWGYCYKNNGSNQFEMLFKDYWNYWQGMVRNTPIQCGDSINWIRYEEKNKNKILMTNQLPAMACFKDTLNIFIWHNDFTRKITDNSIKTNGLEAITKDNIKYKIHNAIDNNTRKAWLFTRDSKNYVILWQLDGIIQIKEVKTPSTYIK